MWKIIRRIKNYFMSKEMWEAKMSDPILPRRPNESKALSFEEYVNERMADAAIEACMELGCDEEFLVKYVKEHFPEKTAEEIIFRAEVLWKRRKE